MTIETAEYVYLKSKGSGNNFSMVIPEIQNYLQDQDVLHLLLDCFFVQRSIVL